MSENKKSKKDEERRLFLKKILKIFFIFSVTSFSFLSLYILKPSKTTKKDYTYYEIKESQIPKEGVRKIEIKIESLQKSVKIYLVNHKNSIFALSPVCTHLGCFVNYDRNLNEFICPCHGGVYDIEGKVLKGPPKSSLNRFPIKIENNKILIGIKI
ncbi:MAG: ubiquinol-cytochrome c reductase iron-sulfur subunit [Thermodesulfovibrio sp.]|nr:ubiquinol-cytochrome c reductase iron-sulfur subunit [Thermodesulfovibrio sp.]